VTVPEFDRLQVEFGWSPTPQVSHVDLLWTVEGQEASKTSFSEQQLDQLEAGAEGWWYRTRNDVIDDALRQCDVKGTVWEVGSGSGLVAVELRRRSRDVVAVEPGAGGAETSAKRGVPSFYATLEQLGLPTHSLESVGMFDVLEHLEDRSGMLHEVRRVLKPGGHLVLTLPALQFLWSSSDIAAGHFLRYSKHSIQRELEAAGFTVVRSRYFFLLTVLPLFFLRALPHRFGRAPVVSDEELVAKDVGVIGRLASRIERMWARIGLLGSSLLVVARAN
jgi:SAM-dependent methyltransferase